MFSLDLQHFDAMPERALTSDKLYRAEVYAALPRRKEGQYKRDTLGKDRLNISRRTALTYDKLAGLVVTPVLPARQEMTPENVAKLPDHQPKKFRGMRWLETSTGERYPAERGAAILALQRAADNGRPHEVLTMVIRQPNYYKRGEA